MSISYKIVSPTFHVLQYITCLHFSTHSVIKTRKPSALDVKQPAPAVSALFPDDADNVSNPVYDPEFEQDRV